MVAYVLEVVDRTGKTFMVPVSRLPFTLGRAPENDLSLGHKSISRDHAVIEELGSDLVVVDKESRNHVYVNGKEVTRKVLRSGDSLRLGSVEMMLFRAPNIRVRGKGDTLETVYFPQKDSWTQTCFLDEAAPPARRGGPAQTPQDWAKLLHASRKSSATDVYQRVMETIEESAAFDRCFLLVFAAEDLEEPNALQVLERRFSAEYTDRRCAVRANELGISREILRRVVKSREAVLVTEDDPTINTRDTFIESGARTAICFPLIVKHQVGGVLYLDRLTSPQRFTAADVESIGPLAGILALKVENVLLLQETAARDPGGASGN